MSGFVVASGGWSVRSRDDQSGGGEFFTNGDLFLPKIWDRIPADDYFMDTHFGSEWWPRRGGLMGTMDTQENPIIASPLWGSMWTKSGCNSRLGFVGYTRDVYGSIVANCTVRCIRVSTDELVSKVTSDANGFYTATTPYSDAHLLVVHGAGIAGASVDTVLPA